MRILWLHEACYLPKIYCMIHHYVDFLLKTYLNIRFHKRFGDLIWDLTWKICDLRKNGVWDFAFCWVIQILFWKDFTFECRIWFEICPSLEISNRKCYMAYRIMLFPMAMSESPPRSFMYCKPFQLKFSMQRDFVNGISTDIAHTLCDNWASFLWSSANTK